MNRFRRIELLEANVVGAEKPCKVYSFEPRNPEAFDERIRDWPCTRDKSQLPPHTRVCAHWRDYIPKPSVADRSREAH